MNIQQNPVAEQSVSDFPSLSFQVNKDRCSITASCVSTIMLMTEEIVHFPEAPDYCKGLIHLRGQVIPLVDMRTLFAVPSIAAEYEEFCTAVDTHKLDHLEWVAELERCAATGEPFELPTNAHECRMGKWYDTYVFSNATVKAHMRRIEEPHQKLHEVAHSYNQSLHGRDSEVALYAAQQEVAKVRRDLLPQIVGVLDECKSLFMSSVQSVVIVIEGEQGTLGLIVDQVHSVETITPIDEIQSSSYFSRSRFVHGVGKREKSDDTVIILNEQALLQLCDGLQYA